MNIIDLSEKIKSILEEMESDDDTLPILEEATEYFCGNYDKCEGLKYALLLTISDQITHHQDEQDIEDYKKLLAILIKN